VRACVRACVRDCTHANHKNAIACRVLLELFFQRAWCIRMSFLPGPLHTWAVGHTANQKEKYKIKKGERGHFGCELCCMKRYRCVRAYFRLHEGRCVWIFVGRVRTIEAN